MRARHRQEHGMIYGKRNWNHYFLTGLKPAMMRQFLCLAYLGTIATVTTVVSANVAGQETLIGLVGDGFVLLAADGSISSGGVARSSGMVDKIASLLEDGPPMKNTRDDDDLAVRRQGSILAAVAGDAADADRLIGVLRATVRTERYESILEQDDITYVNCSIQKDEETGQLVRQRQFRTTTDTLDVACIAALARNYISQSLRSQNQLKVCLLMGGLLDASNCVDERQRNGCILSSSSSSPAALGVQGQIRAAATSASRAMILAGSEEKADDCNDAELEENVPWHTQTKTARNESPTDTSTAPPLKPFLYWLDEYGAMESVPYGVQGYAATMLWSVLDRGYKPKMSVAEALELLEECLQQLRTRYVFNSGTPPEFCVKLVDKKGCRFLKLRTEKVSET